MADGPAGCAIHVDGMVQGVGFRPYVYRLATAHGLTGWVRNSSAGVDIEVTGLPSQIEDFLSALKAGGPPLARIEGIAAQTIAPASHHGFIIEASQDGTAGFLPVPPDIATCPDCLRELFDPSDRRYRYPFITCTHCGPRFTIITRMPYDRPDTTMSGFPLCPDCAREYHDPTDRRFHAQPVACPRCGPAIWFVTAHDAAAGADPGDALCGEDALQAAVSALYSGQVVAIRGLGGFHLACDATDPAAVARLRQRKGRPHKPLAVMVADAGMAGDIAALSPAEQAALAAQERPIVLLARHTESRFSLASVIAPGQHTIGVMLPYTPLHALLFAVEQARPLVMTSGNPSGLPICTDNAAASEALSSVADAFLFHNRPIHIRADDSVVRVFRGVPSLIRRARGYAPEPLSLPFEVWPLLAGGPELKNTFCLAAGKRALLSHHIGDMTALETLTDYEQAVSHYENLFGIRPGALVCDQHPDYLTTRYIKERAARDDLPVVGVQHHHAHVAACLAEHGIPPDKRVIGVVFDGTGYGSDGAIWGGEFLIAGYDGFERAAHLDYLPLPGGDAAVKAPARTGLAYLIEAGVETVETLPPGIALSEPERRILRRQVADRLNAPHTSSIGRLFDAVASITGLCHYITYEGQAAIELEAVAERDEEGAYPFPKRADVIDPRQALRQIACDVRGGIPRGVIAARFHNGLARSMAETCVAIRAEVGLADIVLSGGVFQNAVLLEKSVTLLERAGFSVLTHRLVPANDGGVALGQAAVAGWRLAQTSGGGYEIS